MQRYKAWIKENSVSLWWLIFSLFLLQELIIKVEVWYEISFLGDRLPKLLAQLLVISIFFTGSKLKNRLLPFMFLLLCFVIGHGYYNNWVLTEKWLESIKLFNKYLFPIITLMALVTSNKLAGKIKEHLCWFFTIVLCLNSLLIILGLLTGVEFFRSYPFSDRFGYSGIFYHINDVSIFYALGLSLLFYRSFLLKRQPIWLFFVVYGISFFLGTKLILINNALLLLIVLYISIYKFAISKMYIVIGIVLISLLFIAVLMPILSFTIPIFQEQGLFYALSSFRTELLVNSSLSIFQEWDFINWLMGGVHFKEQKIEMDFIDAFFFWGICGFIIYTYLLFNYMFTYRQNKGIENFLVTIVIINSFLAGHLLWSGLNCIYFAIWSLVFWSRNLDKSKVKND